MNNETQPFRAERLWGGGVGAGCSPRRDGARRLRRASAAALLAVVACTVAVGSAPVAAQDATGTDSPGDAEVRIVARKLQSGRIEFGLQQRQADASWGDRQLPRVRFFPTTATVGRWLASSALALPAGEMRIVARKLQSGRIEFGLQQRQPDDSWGDRQLPRVRFFPTTATVGRWLASSPFEITTPQTTARYTASTTNDTYRCRLRSDHTLMCVGERQLVEAPDGQYTSITAAGTVFQGRDWCGLRTDGTIACWGFYFIDVLGDAPAGHYTAVSAGTLGACGLRTDSTITCWGEWEADAPEGHYTSVIVTASRVCALRTDGSVICRPGWSAPTDAFTGQYTAIVAGEGHACGLRTDGTVTCVSDALFALAEVPAGQYLAISAGDYHSCGLRTDGTVTCWGGPYSSGTTEVPAGFYTAIAGGATLVNEAGYACGLRTDDTLICWGDDYVWEIGGG